MERIERKISYMFQYESGKKVHSGANGGTMICGRVDHELTKVGDIVEISQFWIQGAGRGKAKIIGKKSFDWDWSKPFYQRMSNLVIEGEME